MGLLKRHASCDLKQIQNIQSLQTKIQSLNAIVTNFLRFARQPQLQYQVFAIAELFRETLLLAENQLQEKDISVQFNIQDKNLVLNADFNQDFLYSIYKFAIQMSLRGAMRRSYPLFLKGLLRQKASCNDSLFAGMV